ncbi:MAG TPA: HAMP domain-containing sensor histidine kinase [Actinomycetota bacterium]|nr:HAMP domain-containing sensor histidine kinase [Actinomycetota bacterium]
MSLRSKLAITFAVLAAIVAGLMGLLGYTATGNQLERSMDQSLLAQGGAPMMGHREDRGRDPMVVLSADGQVTDSRGNVQLPVTDADRAVAASTRATVITRTASVQGTPYRILTASPGQSRGAVLVGRDWSQSAAVLNRLAVVLTVCVLLLSAAGAVVGWLIARRITKPLIRLTNTAEQVSDSGRLDVEVPGAGSDEVGRLAASFNTMLGRLATSQAEQQRLVQDAGHELRTPLTSLRTNISLLERFDELSPPVRARVVADLRGESRELTGLVNEVLALAGGQGAEEEPQNIRLAEVVQRIATRARRRTQREVTVSTDDSQIIASRPAVERAVWNLVDNAAKFDPSGAPIDILVTDGTLEVLDRGPGVPAEDLPHVFDRFYRAVTSRSLPGSGLGLAIVKDVAQASGGRAYVHPREGGGSVFGIAWPPAASA